MTPQEFEIALEAIRRDNPMGRQMDQALRARKQAVAGLLHDMDDDEIQRCMREASVRNLPRHMIHMVGVEARARLKNKPSAGPANQDGLPHFEETPLEKEETDWSRPPPEPPNAWERLMDDG